MAIHGKIYSAEPLTDQQIAELTAYFCRKLNDPDVHLRQDIDKRLIGGFVVHIGGMAYDASLRYKLEELHDLMLEADQ